jgi:hypothetical protein
MQYSHIDLFCKSIEGTIKYKYSNYLYKTLDSIIVQMHTNIINTRKLQNARIINYETIYMSDVWNNPPYM